MISGRGTGRLDALLVRLVGLAHGRRSAALMYVLVLQATSC